MNPSSIWPPFPWRWLPRGLATCQVSLPSSFLPQSLWTPLLVPSRAGLWCANILLGMWPQNWCPTWRVFNTVVSIQLASFQSSRFQATDEANQERLGGLRDFCHKYCWPQMYAFLYEWTRKSAFGCSFLSDSAVPFPHWVSAGRVAWRACARESLISTPPKCSILQLLRGPVEIRCTCLGLSVYIYRCTHMRIHIS